MKKLGLDLGSSSAGWVITENHTVVKKGVVVFSTGMTKGTGGYSSPTKDRREARSKRRLIQARKYRKWALLKVLSKSEEYTPLTTIELEIWSDYQKGIQRKFPESENFLKWLACDFTYLQNGIKHTNPYEIRVQGLDKKLSKHEFGRALYHIVQRRGYKDIGEKDKETQTQIDRRGESGFDKAMRENRSIAEALQKEFLDKGKRARNEYPYREEYESEFNLLCKAQGLNIEKEKKGEYNDSFVKSLWKAIIWQRPLRSQKGTIGKCTLEPKSLRIPISHPLFEMSRALQYINTVKTVDKDGIKSLIPQKYRDDLFIKVFLNNSSNYKFSKIKTHLDKLFTTKKEYNYLNKRTQLYDSPVSGMPVCKQFIDVFGKTIIPDLINLCNYDSTRAPKIIKGYSIHDLWHIVFEKEEDTLKTFAENKLDISSSLKKKGKKEVLINDFANLKSVFAQGYGDLSAKALKKIIPFLKDGYLYSEAVILAKIPESLGEKWEENKELVLEIIKSTSDTFEFNSNVINITNGLINTYKGLGYNEELGYHEQFAQTTDYVIQDSDIKAIENASIKYFGERSWEKLEIKEDVSIEVKNEYQLFFQDRKRRYREKTTQVKIFQNLLQANNLSVNGDLYHHSNRKNLYPKPVFDKKLQLNLLAVPLIDSIKNPMFNKVMTILRKLINELIKTGDIDEDTEIVIELARELNDNNKRAAIERYQNERRDKREKYRTFLAEFKNNNPNFSSLNVEERISDFELWTEQIFDENNKKIDSKDSNRLSILKEKKAVDRYELWTEQKGQCMYTGKMISITQLFSSEIQMEHTIPRSLLPDNTMANQTVCFSKYNNDIKNNRIPFECPNYTEDSNGFSAITPRLSTWEQQQEYYQKKYDENKRAKGSEDENAKNKRIQYKHYCKMHLDYWRDKLNRFTCEEIKDSWVRRQLVDTQMVSKYAREFLKTYFKKVNVQKGIVTAEFRKIYGFQEEDAIKSRNKHTHHAIDAAVLTLIPSNASRKVRLLEKSYKYQEQYKKQFTTQPYSNFDAQKLIREIEDNTLIYNYTKDKIITQTYKKVRKRGVIQKNEDGTIQWMKGNSVRGDLYGKTYLAKIKDVERFDDGQPIREDGEWKYKQGKNEFIYVKRIFTDDVKTELSNGKPPQGYVIDPAIRKIIADARKNKIPPKDSQGKIIRHVRTITKTGREVKQRVNYLSQHDYKNKFYSESGAIPYAILLQKVVDGTVERKMIPVAIHEVAKTFKQHRTFNAELYLGLFHRGLKEQYDDWKLLSVGQKVIVLNNDKESVDVQTKSFQINRLYKIIQFSEGNIWLQYHKESRDVAQIKQATKNTKSDIVKTKELELELPLIKEDDLISDSKKRKKDFEDKMFKFSSLKDYRLNRLQKVIGLDAVKKIQVQLGQYKAISSKIELEGETPLLKTSKENWLFLYEGLDFNMNVLGEILFTDDWMQAKQS